MSRTTTKNAPSILLRLMGLVLACTLPASLLAVLLIYHDYQLTYKTFIDSAMATARANASEVDKEFALIESSLVAFSTSPDFDRANLQHLDAQARKLVARERILNVVLEDATGQQLLNTYRPFGEPLPQEADSPSLRFMRDNDRTFISSIFSGPVTGRRMVAVGIPCKTGAGDWLALTATLSLERFSEMLRERHYPNHWITSILDRAGRIVARSADIDRLAGTEAAPSVREQIRKSREGAFEAQTVDGKAILAVTARAPRSGWTVAIGIPLDELKADMRRKAWSLVLVTMALMGLGLLIAWRIGTTIRRAMQGLIAPAMALGANQAVTPASYGVREADEVGDALVKASTMLQSAQHQATHDVLTGIANRAMFHAFLERQLAAAQRGQAQLSVLYLDLDKFKPINDTHGHAIGDKLLIEASARLTSQLRKTDLAARMGGDEFAVVVAGGAAESAIVANKLGRLLGQPYHIDGIELRSAASIGVATYPQSGTTIESILAAADIAMYQAKAARKAASSPTAGAEAFGSAAAASSRLSDGRSGAVDKSDAHVRK